MKEIETKKRDNSYRIFKRIQRKSGCFPQAEERRKDLDDGIQIHVQLLFGVVMIILV